MTKKEFLFAMQRGLGRGILAVKKDPQKFREIVLKNCATDFCYDSQCEGPRAWYVYQMISCYEDTGTFVKLLSEKLLKKSSFGWQIAHLSTLLAYFAEDGSMEAKNALWQKYEELYQVLSTRQRAPRRYFYERDAFENICIALSYDFDAYKRIAKDIGTLYLTKTFFHDDFHWLYLCNERKYNAALKKEAKYCPEIKHYVETQLAEKRRAKAERDLRRNRLRSERAEKENDLLEEYANRYLNETDEEKRAETLNAFRFCPFPFEPTPIIKDAGSEVEELKNAAFRVLENTRHPLVREFALQNLETDLENFLPLLIKNYLPEDEEWLYRFISELKIDREDSSNWHAYHFDIQDLFDKKDGVQNPPKRFLPLMYEQTLCSCCREYTLKYMGKWRMLTTELLNECLYDCNEDIRNYAKKKLALRKKKLE